MFREFPARAGINRIKFATLALRDRVPRASGDKPAHIHGCNMPSWSSPRERG